MVSGNSIPVIAGMAAGIALIVSFSMAFKPDSMLTDEVLISKYSKVPEVTYFLEKYPDANVEIVRSPLERSFSISFDVTRQVDPTSHFYTGINLFGILIHTNPYHFSIDTYCGKTGITFQSGLRGTTMLDEAGKECLQTSYQEQQFTIVASSVNGKSLGLRLANSVEPEVIDEYWLLMDLVAQVDSGGLDSNIVYQNINPSETTGFLMDDRLDFTQTCLEMVCYDELSTFINLGQEKSYFIRVFAGDDPYDFNTEVKTGIFEPDPTGDELMGGGFVIEETDGDTTIEIQYNED